MFTTSGISVDSCARVEADCDVTCDVVGEEVQFRFGSQRSTGLTVVFTQRSLEQVVTKSTDALRVLRDQNSSCDNEAS